jgi:hypothetical protein
MKLGTLREIKLPDTDHEIKVIVYDKEFVRILDFEIPEQRKD